MKALRELINTNNGARIIDEFNDNGKITEDSRRDLVSIMTGYAWQLGRGSPTLEQKKSIVSAIIAIFPCLGNNDVITSIVSLLIHVLIHSI